MSVYTPEEWCFVEIKGSDPHLRVFGSWRGGYTTSDSWRLNSGITAVDKEGEYWIFYGSTGSEYRCHEDFYGIASPWNRSVLGDYAVGSNGTMVVIDEEPVDVYKFVDNFVNKV